MAKFRQSAAPVKASSRQRAPENTAVHRREAVHESTQQSAEHQVERVDAADSWSRPTNLDAPPQRPGMKQRWIRVKLGDKTDTKRIRRALTEGWRPRPPDSVPKGFSPETVSFEGIGNVISADDMVLMEMPLQMFEQKQRYVADKRARAMEAVDQDLLKTERAGGLPINRRRKTQVSVNRRGRVVNPD